MGRSAKFLKKVSYHKYQADAHSCIHADFQVKKTAGTTQRISSIASQKPSTAPSAPVEQKKKSNLKSKAQRRKSGSEGYVLEGADYVELLMGSRKKAREEAAKLPKQPE